MSFCSSTGRYGELRNLFPPLWLVRAGQENRQSSDARKSVSEVNNIIWSRGGWSWFLASFNLNVAPVKAGETKTNFDIIRHLQIFRCCLFYLCLCGQGLRFIHYLCRRVGWQAASVWIHPSNSWAEQFRAQPALHLVIESFTLSARGHCRLEKKQLLAFAWMTALDWHHPLLSQIRAHKKHVFSGWRALCYSLRAENISLAPNWPFVS